MCLPMRPVTRHLRQIHSIPEVILNLDLFKQHQDQSFTHKNQRSAPSINDLQESTQAQRNLQNRYNNVLEELRKNPEFETILRVRTERVQSFLGNELPLTFSELLGVLCGLSNMNLKTSPLPAGSLFGDVFTSQDTLRQLGIRFFEFQCTKTFIFDDIQYLTCTAEELEQSIATFSNKESLITRLMDDNDLSECFIPYRGVHSVGLIRNRTAGFRQRIKDKTCVASFYSMLGILVRKFGSDAVVKEFWNPKMLHPTKGLLSLALKEKV